MDMMDTMGKEMERDVVGEMMLMRLLLDDSARPLP